MKKHLGIMAIYMKNSIMSQLEYRINFISSVLFEIAYFLVKLTYAFVVLSTNMTVGDLGPYHIITFIGVFTLLTGIFVFASPGIFSFSQKVYTGELDYFLTKPVSLVVIASLSQYNFGSGLANFLSGVALTVWGLANVQEPFTLGALGMGTLMIVIGTVMSYLMFLLPQFLSFWVLKVNRINMAIWSLWDFNNMPMVIYPQPVQWVGLFILPIFLLTNPPAFALLGRLEPWLLVATIVATLILFLLFCLTWRQGIKRYHSVNNN